VINQKYGFLALGLQTVQGTPAAQMVKIPFAAKPSIHPQKPRANYSRTDATLGPAPTYTSSLGFSGQFEIELHPDWAHLIFAWALGGIDSSEDDDVWTHVLTPSSDTMFATVGRGVGNVIVEQAVDVKVVNCTVKGEAGGYFTMVLDVVGISVNKNVGAWDTLPLDRATKGLLYAEAKNLLKIDAVARRMEMFEFGYGTGSEAQQADDYFAYDITPGDVDPTFTCRLPFAGPDAEPTNYNAFFYAGGDVLSPVVATKPISVGISRSASSSITIDIAQTTYTTFEVNPDPAGGALKVQLETAIEIPDDGETPIVEITVVNEKVDPFD